MLDPYPRLIVFKGIGMFSTGPSLKDAKIAMDVGLNSLSVILEAAKFGEFRSIPEKEIFKMEYWPLELAKIKPSTQKLKGHVTVISGGLGAIGYATAQKFLKEGNRVKFSLRFKGREMEHSNLGIDMLKRVKSDLEELTRVEMEPKIEGRQAFLVVAPK